MDPSRLPLLVEHCPCGTPILPPSHSYASLTFKLDAFVIIHHGDDKVSAPSQPITKSHSHHSYLKFVVTTHPLKNNNIVLVLINIGDATRLQNNGH
ncbi:hypothetical protein SESBI_29476 [Sesbania bispinosa]|nr:hypothetical protein SESBI_29476 [Sesbania bispinosa]